MWLLYEDISLMITLFPLNKIYYLLKYNPNLIENVLAKTSRPWVDPV